MKLILTILAVASYAVGQPPTDLIAEADEWAGNPSANVNSLPTVALGLGERVGFTFQLRGSDSITITHFGVYAADEEECEFLGVEVWDLSQGYRMYSGEQRVRDADYISISDAEEELTIWNNEPKHTYAVVVTPLLSQNEGEGCGKSMLYTVNSNANSTWGANEGASWDPNDNHVDILEAGRYLPGCGEPGVWAPADAPYANFFVLFGYSVVAF